MSAAPAARVGDPVDAIGTPALVIDLDAMERNLATMADFARAHRVRLRPHAKMHKSAVIAALQMRAGAVGVCVQKVGEAEAEALAAAGVTDIYVSNEVVAESKLARLAALAGRIRLAVAVDSALGIDRLAAALKAAGTRLDVFVEIDVGQGRCGVAPAAAVGLAHALFVKSQVMSPGASHAVVDAGHKAHSIDSGPPRVWQRDLVFTNGGDEHGILMAQGGAATLPQLGETVWLVPGHCDPTVNLHAHYIAVRGGLAAGTVDAVWPIDARGRLT